MSNVSHITLERLIREYEAACLAQRPDEDEINRLALAVEEEAERVGYDNHLRLLALHNLAEAATELGPDPLGDWHGRNV